MRRSIVTLLFTCLSLVLTSSVVAQDDPLAASNALIQAGKWEEAVAALDAVVAEDETNNQAWFNLGVCHQQLGHAEQAYAAYEKAVEAGAFAPRAYFAAARTAGAAGQGDKAIHYLDKVVEAGGSPYIATQNTAEFQSLQDKPGFQKVLEKMKPCNSPEYRHFDFWIGNWNVSAGGNFVGTNEISQQYGGCTLVEKYDTPRGFTGTSLNFYDSTAGHWHQTWIDNTGQVLEINGGLVDGKMVMTSAPGNTMSRVTWTPNEDGSVRQLWESSADGGETWTPAFDGHYVRQTEESEAP